MRTEASLSGRLISARNWIWGPVRLSGETVMTKMVEGCPSNAPKSTPVRLMPNAAMRQSTLSVLPWGMAMPFCMPVLMRFSRSAIARRTASRSRICPEAVSRSTISDKISSLVVPLRSRLMVSTVKGFFKFIGLLHGKWKMWRHSDSFGGQFKPQILQATGLGGTVTYGGEWASLCLIRGGGWGITLLCNSI